MDAAQRGGTCGTWRLTRRRGPRSRCCASWDPDLAVAPGTDEPDVPDPYAGGPDGFARVYDQVADACAGLLVEVRRRLAAGAS